MHLRLSHEAEQCECLEIDYGFLGDPEAAATEMPILVGRTRINKAIWASPVPHKGVVDSPHGTNRLMSWLDETGLRRITIKSDNEPAIVALVRAAKAGWSGELLVEHTP